MESLEKTFQSESKNQKDIELENLIQTNARLRWLIDDLKIKLNNLFYNFETDFPDALAHNQNLVDSIKKQLIF